MAESAWQKAEEPAIVRRDTRLARRARRWAAPLLLLVANWVVAERIATHFLPSPKAFPSLYRPHPTRFWTLDGPGWRVDPAGNSLYLNSLGMRAEELSADRPALSVLMLGDSCTFGFGLDSADTIDRLLERALARVTGRTVRVLNAGCPAYSSYQGLDWFAEIGPLIRPDIVLVAYRYADRGKEPTPDKERQGGWWMGRMRSFLWKSAIYQVVRNAIQGPPMGGDADGYSPTLGGEATTYRVSCADFEGNLRAIARQAHALGARGVAFVLLPNVFHEDGARVDHSAALYAVGEREGIVVDGTLLWKNREALDSYFYDGLHFNAKGARAFTTDLLDALLKSGWVRAGASVEGAQRPGVAPSGARLPSSEISTKR